MYIVLLWTAAEWEKEGGGILVSVVLSNEVIKVQDNAIFELELMLISNSHKSPRTFAKYNKKKIIIK